MLDPCWLRSGLCPLDADHQTIRSFLLPSDLRQSYHEKNVQGRHGLGDLLERWEHITSRRSPPLFKLVVIISSLSLNLDFTPSLSL